VIVVLADVEARLSGWYLRITQDGDTYNASLAGPGGSDGMNLRRWPSVERVFESIEGYLRARDLAHVWVALHANAVAEMAQ
jgi:hypothetical protein